MGRHHAPGAVATTPPRRNIVRLLLGVGLVALLVAVLAVILGNRVGSKCGEPENYSILVDPSLTSAVRAGVDGARDDCTTFSVLEAPDAQVATRLTGGEQAPDLWLAPGRGRLDAVAAQVDRDLPAAPVAASPIVLAGAAVAPPATWLDALGAPEIRSVPASSPYAGAPVVASVAEGERPGADKSALTAALARFAQTAAPVAGEPVAAAAKSAGVVPVPEYAYLAAKRGDAGVTATVPRTGTTGQELLLVTTATGPRRAAAQAAADTLTAHLTSGAGTDALADGGLRGLKLTPPAKNGVGEVTALPAPSPQELAAANQSFDAVAVPIKTTVVVDTSGSMETPVGNSTRIGLLSAGFSRVVSLIAPANSVGLWSFSYGVGGRPDWTEVVPGAPLDTPRGNTTQRQVLIDQSNALPEKTGGATGLYDTTLAAYDKALREFDPAYANSVIIETDGRDENPGGMSLDELVDQLKERIDPARPVTIHTLAISADADRDALQRIAETTGGTANFGETEQQILQVFSAAIAKRAN